MPADPTPDSQGSAADPDLTGEHEPEVGSAPRVAAEATDSSSIAIQAGNDAQHRSRARIARIQAALLSGSYRVDLDKLAETIVKNGVLKTATEEPDR
jgi:anti-sigma28 factor (negative regulator of flagellin synthesis)